LSTRCARRSPPRSTAWPDQAGIDSEPFVEIDDAFKRPAEVDLLVGDPAKAKRVLGWEPRTNFEQLIRLMVDADLELLSR
jgi:GDPmannose 4,6-dehydratase